jgi:probable rRNA maturation factor
MMDRSEHCIDLALANPNRYPEVRLRRLRAWLTDLLTEIGPGYDSLGVLFASDRRLRELNRDFREKDRSTDVLSFPGAETPEGRHLGDVAVSVPAARRQARQAGHAVETELEILLLHGVLHCLGYDHEADDGRMDRREARLRGQWIRAMGAGTS